MREILDGPVTCYWYCTRMQRDSVLFPVGLGDVSSNTWTFLDELKTCWINTGLTSLLSCLVTILSLDYCSGLAATDMIYEECPQEILLHNPDYWLLTNRSMNKQECIMDRNGECHINIFCGSYCKYIWGIVLQIYLNKCANWILHINS